MIGLARRTLLKTRDAFAKVRTTLGEHPLLTNITSYSVMCAMAETSQQFLERQFEFRRDKEAKKHDQDSDRVVKRRQYDWQAVGRMVTVGGLLMAPSLHLWYKILDSKVVGTTWNIVAKKVALDLTVPTIPLYCMFYIATSYLEGKEDVFAELFQKFWATYFLSVCFWVPVQAFNFTALHPSRRVIFVAAATFVELNLLCLLKRYNPNVME